MKSKSRVRLISIILILLVIVLGATSAYIAITLQQTEDINPSESSAFSSEESTDNAGLTCTNLSMFSEVNGEMVQKEIGDDGIYSFAVGEKIQVRSKISNGTGEEFGIVRLLLGEDTEGVRLKPFFEDGEDPKKCPAGQNVCEQKYTFSGDYSGFKVGPIYDFRIESTDGKSIANSSSEQCRPKFTFKPALSPEVSPTDEEEELAVCSSIKTYLKGDATKSEKTNFKNDEIVSVEVVLDLPSKDFPTFNANVALIPEGGQKNNFFGLTQCKTGNQQCTLDFSFPQFPELDRESQYHAELGLSDPAIFDRFQNPNCRSTEFKIQAKEEEPSVTPQDTTTPTATATPTSTSTPTATATSTSTSTPTPTATPTKSTKPPLVISVNPEVVAPGGEVTTSIIYTNNSTVAETLTYLTANIPNGAKYVPNSTLIVSDGGTRFTVEPTINGNQLRWDFPSNIILQPGEKVTLTFRFIAPASTQSNLDVKGGTTNQTSSTKLSVTGNPKTNINLFVLTTLFGLMLLLIGFWKIKQNAYFMRNTKVSLNSKLIKSSSNQIRIKPQSEEARRISENIKKNSKQFKNKES